MEARDGGLKLYQTHHNNHLLASPFVPLPLYFSHLPLSSPSSSLGHNPLSFHTSSSFFFTFQVLSIYFSAFIPFLDIFSPFLPASLITGYNVMADGSPYGAKKRSYEV